MIALVLAIAVPLAAAAVLVAYKAVGGWMMAMDALNQE